MKQPRYVYYAVSVWRRSKLRLATGELRNLLYCKPRISEVQYRRNQWSRKQSDALYDRLIRLYGFDRGLNVYMAQ